MTSQITGYIGKYKTQDNIVHSFGSTAYGYCETPAATAAKVVDMTGFTLIKGATVFIKFQYANTANSPTLNVNNTGAIAIKRYGTTAPSGTSAGISGQWNAGAVIAFTYDGAYWQEHYWYNTTYYVTCFGCGTTASTAKKVFSNATYMDFSKSQYIILGLVYTNTYEGQLTASITVSSVEYTFPIYLNGIITSSTNYNWSKGYYIGYFDGTNFYFNTDGTIPFVCEEAPDDGGYYVRKNKTWVDITSMLNI